MEEYIVALAIIISIYLLLALGLTLQYGLTGISNFGIVGFFAIGAYTSALLSKAGLPIVAGLGAAILVSAIVSFPIGQISLRLRDDYFAIVTLGFSEALRLVITNETWLTGGIQGIPGIPSLYRNYFGSAEPMAVLITLILVSVVVITITWQLKKSPFGRILEAIRDDEEAVITLGKDPAAFKVQTLMLGSGIAGLAGAFYAHYITYVSPDQFIPIVTFYVWMAIIIGGVGRLWGALTGTVILILLLEGTRFARDFIPLIPDSKMASFRLLLVGVLLVGFTLFKPTGLVGDFTKR